MSSQLFLPLGQLLKKCLRPNKSQSRSLRVVQVVEKGWLAARESVETRH